MDSIDLIDLKKRNPKSYINQTIETNQKSKVKKCIDLKLIILCLILVSNLYLVYLFKSKFNFNGISFTRPVSQIDDSIVLPQTFLSNISKSDKKKRLKILLKNPLQSKKIFVTIQINI